MFRNKRQMKFPLLYSFTLLGLVLMAPAQVSINESTITPTTVLQIQDFSLTIINLGSLY
jgi:hypothetical protein